MLNKTFPLLLIALFICLSAQQTNGAKFHNRQLFVSKFAKQAVKGHNFLTTLKTAQTSIREQALQGLKSLPSSIKSDLLKEADHQLKSAAYPQLTATLFMGYFRTGSRDPYSSLYDEHLRRVATLTVGHLLEKESGTAHHQHKYLDEIVNGLWSLMEQSTWCMPHHLVHQGTSDHLPLPDRQAIDLNAGEVAKLVAWVRLLLHEDLDRVVSKVVVKRIDAELRRRIFDPYMSRRGFSWEGFANHFVNNWNIWCNGNVLKAAVYTLKGDEPYFTSVLNRSLYSADFFLDDYGEDGGCEEGPAYWREAGGRLLDYLDSLERLFPKEAETYFSEQKLLKAIGEYAYKMRITGNWFVNFADAVPVLTYPPELLLKYGDLFKDEVMRKYAAFMWGAIKRGQQSSGSKSHFVAMLGSGDLNGFFSFVEIYSRLESLKAEAPELDTVWLPNIQVMAVRSKKATEVEEKSRFFLAAKAGNNYESHNHNDVGSFILFQGGHPVLIDIGVGTYNSKTFSSHRYEIFYMQSQYHNGLPTINGVQQHEGSSYSSHGVTFKDSQKNSTLNNDEVIHFSMDIAGAYPKSAHVLEWKRELSFNRSSNTIHLSDHYHLGSFLHPQQLHFMVPSELQVTPTKEGLHLSDTKKGVNVKMAFDWSLWQSPVKIELKSLEKDHKLTSVWGEQVKRLTLVTEEKFKATKGHFEFSWSSNH